MKRFATGGLLVLLALAAGLSGCGGDKGTGGTVGDVPPSPGTGTGTILADVRVSGNEETPGSFGTDFVADLQDSLNAPINNATVYFNHRTLGRIDMPLDTIAGRYRATRNGYVSGSYTLTITRGTESITGATVTAPVIHTPTYPTLTDTVPQGAFTALWTRTTKADTAEVETKDFPPALTSDDGDFTVPTNQPKPDQMVRIRRSNIMILAGGRPGSTLIGRFTTKREPVVVQ